MALKIKKRVRRLLRLHAPAPRPDLALTRLLAAEEARWDRARKAAAGGPRVLVATSIGGFTTGTAVESLLAVALTLQGAAVEMLLCDEALPACLQATVDGVADLRGFARDGPQRELCAGCHRAGGLALLPLGLPVRRYSDLLGAEDRLCAEKVAASARGSEVSGLEWEGVPVGEHAMAGALRFFARGTLPEGRTAEAVMRRFVAAAVLSAAAAGRILESGRYECAAFHHGIYVPLGLIGEQARRRGVRVVNWHVAYRKRRLLFSHYESYHHTLVSEPISAWADLRLTADQERDLLGYLRSRWQGTRDWIAFHEKPEVGAEEVRRRLPLDWARPVIGLLTNVMWDAKLHYRANAFPDMLEWVLATIEHFRRRPHLQLLIRVHPAEVRGTIPSRQPLMAEISKAFPRLPDNIHVVPPESPVSTYAAMLQCDSAIIYGTKMGVELTALGIPVIVAGEAWIKNKGLTVDAATPEEYFGLLDRLPFGRRMADEQVARARRYAYHFFFRRMIPLEALEPAPGVPPFRLAVGSLDECRPGRSAGLDVICDGILRGSPFVYPAESLPATPE